MAHTKHHTTTVLGDAGNKVMERLLVVKSKSGSSKSEILKTAMVELAKSYDGQDPKLDALTKDMIRAEKVQMHDPVWDLDGLQLNCFDD